MQIHLKVMYQELTEEQLEGIMTISKDSVMRNGIDAWFEPKDEVSDADIDRICTQFHLIRID